MWGLRRVVGSLFTCSLAPGDRARAHPVALLTSALCLAYVRHLPKSVVPQLDPRQPRNSSKALSRLLRPFRRSSHICSNQKRNAKAPSTSSPLRRRRRWPRSRPRRSSTQGYGPWASPSSRRTRRTLERAIPSRKGPCSSGHGVRTLSSAP